MAVVSLKSWCRYFLTGDSNGSFPHRRGSTGDGCLSRAYFIPRARGMTACAQMPHAAPAMGEAGRNVPCRDRELSERFVRTQFVQHLLSLIGELYPVVVVEVRLRGQLLDSEIILADALEPARQAGHAGG